MWRVLAAAMELAKRSASGFLMLHIRRLPGRRDGCGAVTEAASPPRSTARATVFALGADGDRHSRRPHGDLPGSHGDRGAHRADIILPGAAWTEGAGAVRQHRGTAPAGTPRAASRRARRRRTGDSSVRSRASLARPCPIDSLAALRQALVAEVPHLKCIDEVPENEWKPLERGGDEAGRFALRRHRALPRQPDHARPPN